MRAVRLPCAEAIGRRGLGRAGVTTAPGAHTTVVVWEPAADVLSTDERFREALALTRQETAAGISAVVGRVHPDDRERLLGAVGAAVEDRAEFSDAHRVVRPDGSVAHFSLRGCAVQGGHLE